MIDVNFRIKKNGPNEIENVTHVIDFSQVDEKEREKFIEKIILRQTELAGEYLEHFYFDGAELIDFINKIKLVEIVRNLSGVINGREIIGVIIRVLEENFSKTFFN